MCLWRKVNKTGFHWFHHNYLTEFVKKVSFHTHKFLPIFETYKLNFVIFAYKYWLDKFEFESKFFVNASSPVEAHTFPLMIVCRSHWQYCMGQPFWYNMLSYIFLGSTYSLSTLIWWLVLPSPPNCYNVTFDVHFLH